MDKILTFALPPIIVIAVILILASGYVKAPPDVAYIISDIRKTPRVLIGRAGIKIPFLERVDRKLPVLPPSVPRKQTSSGQSLLPKRKASTRKRKP